MRDENNNFGWSVAWAAFVLAMLAWGVGFYGPSVFLQVLHDKHGWSITDISMAITVHFLLSAVLIAYLPEIHRRFGVGGTTFMGGLLMAVGLIGWSRAGQPWHLFVAAVPSAIGWAMTSGAALNAIISVWFERDRPKAMSLAFNGASVGGVLFVPLWIFMIGRFGFPVAALLIAVVTFVVVAFLAARYFSQSPKRHELSPAGDPTSPGVLHRRPTLTRVEILQTPRFLTLSAAFSLGLFAQIGLLAHLIVRLTPDVGVTVAGLLVSLATVCAVLGRLLLGWWIGERDRRLAAAANFVVQLMGVLFFIFGDGWLALTIGCVLFGLGIGNLTSLPPLIAQKEFERGDVVTVVALIVAINQAVFAFAPVIFGAIRDATSSYDASFGIVAFIQFLAAVIVVSGRKNSGLSKTSA